MGKTAGKMPSQRQLRVAEEIRRGLVNIFQRGELRDPQLANISVTVSEVRISPDLNKAIAFLTPLGGGETESMITAMGKAIPFIRHRLSQELTLKFVPTISFQADHSFDYAERISEVLRSADSGSKM